MATEKKAKQDFERWLLRAQCWLAERSAFKDVKRGNRFTEQLAKVLPSDWRRALQFGINESLLRTREWAKACESGRILRKTEELLHFLKYQHQ